MNWAIGINMYTLMCIKLMTNENLLYKKINKIKFKNSKKKETEALFRKRRKKTAPVCLETSPADHLLSQRTHLFLVRGSLSDVFLNDIQFGQIKYTNHILTLL